MKKLLLSVLAISALVACSKSDVIEMPQSQAIKFGSAFVDNSTKAAYDPIDPTWEYNSNGAHFYVWGKLTPDGSTVSTNIFNGVNVTKVQTNSTDIGAIGTWFYDDDYVQYWIPTVDYSFAAIAGIGSAATDVTRDENLMPVSISYDASTQNDLVYATAEAEGKTSANDEVKFTFNHLLSKVKFTFDNKYPSNSASSNLYIKVDDIQIIDAHKSGTYTIANAATTPWTFSTPATNYNQSFGKLQSTEDSPKNIDYIAPNTSGVSAYERLMIPATYAAGELKIAFKANVLLLQGTGVNPTDYTEISALTSKYTYTTTYLTNKESITLKPNCTYNFKIELGGSLDAIQFSVEEVNGWDPDTQYTDKIH